MADVSIGSLFAKLTLKKGGWDAGWKTSEMRLDQFAERSLATMARWAKAFAIAGAAAFVGITVKTAQFEKAVKKTSSVVGGHYDEIAAKARQMGEDTIFSATESANAMYSLASAGLEVEQVIAALEPAMLLAAGGSTTLGNATFMIATALKQFELEAEDAGRIADVYTAAVDNSLFTTDSLREAMKFAGVNARALGWSIEETTAAVAMFANLGLQGGLAGRHFSMAMRNLIDPNDKAKAAIKALGLELKDLDPTMRSFPEIMEAFAKSAFTIKDATSIFTARASGDMAALVESFREGKLGLLDLTDQLEHSAAESRKKYDMMTDAVWGAWKRMTSALESLAIEIGEKWQDNVKDVLIEATDQIKELIDYVKDNGPAIQIWANDMTDLLRESALLIERISKSVNSIFDKLTGGELIEFAGSVVNVLNAILDTVGEVWRRITAISKLNDEVKELIAAGSYLEAIKKAPKVFQFTGAPISDYYSQQMRKYENAAAGRSAGRDIIAAGPMMAEDRGTNEGSIDSMVESFFSGERPKIIAEKFTAGARQVGQVTQEEIREAEKAMAKAWKRYDQNLKDAAKATEKAVKEKARLFAAAEKAAARAAEKKAREVATAAKKAARELEDFLKITEDSDIVEDLEAMDAALNGVSQTVKETTDPMDQLYQSAEKMAISIGDDNSGMVAGMRRVNKAIDDTALAAGAALDETAKKGSSLMRNFGQIIEDSIGGAMKAAIGGAEMSMGSVMRSIGGGIAQGAATRGIGDLTKGLFGKKPSFLGSIGGSILGGGLGAIAGELLGGLFNKTDTVSERHDDRDRAAQLNQQIAAARATIDQSKRAMSGMIQQVNLGQLNMSADEIAQLQGRLVQLEGLEFDAAKAPRSRSSRDWRGNRSVRYNLQNEAQVERQLAEFEEMYGRFSDDAAAIQGTAAFNEREGAFVGSGNQTINNLNTSIGVMIADDRTLDEFAKRMAASMVRLGLVTPGLASV